MNELIRKVLVREPWLALLLLLGLLGKFHVDYDTLDREGLVGDVDDLTAGDVVLMVHALRVPPIKILRRVPVSTVVLKNFVCLVLPAIDAHDDPFGLIVPSTESGDSSRREPLPSACHLATNSRVDDDLPAVSGDDVEVLHGARLVVFEKSFLDVLLLCREAVGVRLNLYFGLLHTGSGPRLRAGPNVAPGKKTERDNRDENCECLLHLRFSFLSFLSYWVVYGLNSRGSGLSAPFGSSPTLAKRQLNLAICALYSAASEL